MKTRRYKHGLSLVEMLIVVGIIALLATMVIGVAGRIDNQSKERGVESTFTLLEGALEEYKEFQGGFPVAMNADPNMNSEILYGQLYSIPVSREVLEKISDSLIKNEYSPSGVLLADTPPEIYDPWSTKNKNTRRVLDYRYDPSRDTFPKLISAGPDRIFGNADDIMNR